MATPNCFKLIVCNDVLERERHFVTYLPIHSNESCEIYLNSLEQGVYKNMLQSCGSNWMQLWHFLNSLALKQCHYDNTLQDMQLLLILKDLQNVCRLQNK
jgi:hypothetical protein